MSTGCFFLFRMYQSLHLHAWVSFSGGTESYNTWFRGTEGHKKLVQMKIHDDSSDPTFLVDNTKDDSVAGISCRLIFKFLAVWNDKKKKNWNYNCRLIFLNFWLYEMIKKNWNYNCRLIFFFLILAEFLTNLYSSLVNESINLIECPSNPIGNSMPRIL